MEIFISGLLQGTLSSLGGSAIAEYRAYGEVEDDVRCDKLNVVISGKWQLKPLRSQQDLGKLQVCI